MIDLRNGQWAGSMAGVGAGLDSFYEYLLKVIMVNLIGQLAMQSLAIYF